MQYFYKFLAAFVAVFLQIGCGKVLINEPPALISLMTNTQIDSLLTVTSQDKSLTITDRMNIYSEFFLNMGYNFTCVGDGRSALLEDYPLVNFKETNCMSYCEHALAMAISDSWDNFFNNLQQLRYKDGIIGMRTRNHYVIADWLPENDWILKDVTQDVGEGLAEPVTRTVSHENFFKGKGISDMRYVKSDRTMTIHYVPMQELVQIQNNLNDSDIAALVYANLEDIFVAHMLMVVVKNGKRYIRESTTRTMSTHDTPYDEWVDMQKDNPRYMGLVFMRVLDELNTPGKIILPWEIADLKRIRQ